MYLSLSFCWACHIFSSLWANLSKVTSVWDLSVCSKIKIVNEWQSHVWAVLRQLKIHTCSYISHPITTILPDAECNCTLISFLCHHLCKHHQEDGWANNRADVNCAVAIVSMAILTVSSGGATVKPSRSSDIRCRLLSPEKEPNPPLDRRWCWRWWL